MPRVQHDINATIILKSADEGMSSRGQISAHQARLGDYLPDLQTIVDTARYFRDAGFTVRPKHHYINIEGSRQQFESMFGVQLGRQMEIDAPGYECIPDMLKDILVRVIFPSAAAEGTT